MEDKNVFRGMNSSTPFSQTKKPGSIVWVVGIGLVVLVTLITIVGLIVFSGVLDPEQQTTGDGLSTLVGAVGLQQTVQQKEISNVRSVCSIGLDVHPLPPSKSTEVSVHWSAQGNIATSSENNFALFSAKDCSAKVTKSIPFYEASWSPDGTKLVAATRSDGALNVLDKDGNSIAHIPFTKLGTNWVGPLVWSSDGMKLTFLSQDANNQSSVKTVDAADGGNVKTLMMMEGDGGALGFLDISPNGRYALGVQLNRATNQSAPGIWDINTGKKVSDLPSNTVARGFSASGFSSDGSLYAQGDYGKVAIYRSADGKLQTSFDADQNTDALAWSHDGKYLAVGGKSITVYDVATQKIVTTFGQVDAQHHISSIAWAPDGSGLVSSAGLTNDDGHSQTSANVWALS